MASTTRSVPSVGIVSGSGATDDSVVDRDNYYIKFLPSVSVIQEEFLDTYRLWREHAEPLDGIDGLLAGDGGDMEGSVLWGEYMARIQKLYARHHRPSYCDNNDGGPWISDLLFEPRSILSPSGSRIDYSTRDRRKCDDEEKVAVSDEEDEQSVDTNTSSGDSDERMKLEAIATLMLRQGTKLNGFIEIQNEARRSTYELVVMEGDARDELGRLKGMLARHNISDFGTANDQQCFFVKVSFVPVERDTQVVLDGGSVHCEVDLREGDATEDEDKGKSQEEDASGEDDIDCDDNKLIVQSNEKLTIQIEYVDGDQSFCGIWNLNTLCFNGTVTNLTEGIGDQQHQMGGTIISGLLSGNRHAHNERRRLNAGNSIRSAMAGSGGSKFSLSPSTHLHPHGIIPAPSQTRRLLLTSQADSSCDDLGQDPCPSLLKVIENEVFTLEKRGALLDELASFDNYKLVLHRSRTEALRRDTLKKLAELGSIVDFAELARKRNIAKRREKWRKRLHKYTPSMPQMPQRVRTSKKTSREDYSLAKDSVLKKKVQFYDLLAVISWGGLLVEASIQSEKTCANFRRQTALLDNLTFDSDEHKAQIMADLRTHGMTMARSHFEWDQCIQMGRAVALGWSWFERGSWSCYNRSAVVGKLCVHLLFMMHSRLETNHMHLEKAFRCAESRLTDMQLERIKKSGAAVFALEAKKDGSVGLCGVCQCDMDEDRENADDSNSAVCFPCSHSFHWDCVKQWLHDHSSCPSCRFDLTESANQTDSVH